MKGEDTLMTEEQRRLDELTGKASTQGTSVQSEVQDTSKQMAEVGKDKVVNAAEQLKTQVSSVGQDVKDRAQSVIEEGKGKITSSLDAVASTLSKTTAELQSSELGQLAPYGEKLQYWTQGLSDYLKNANASDLLSDAESLARRQPAVFLGGAFVVGLLAARFLKSSSSQSMPREDYASGMRYDSSANYSTGASYE
jgi:seryl-tRNA synthetase